MVLILDISSFPALPSPGKGVPLPGTLAIASSDSGPEAPDEDQVGSAVATSYVQYVCTFIHTYIVQYSTYITNYVYIYIYIIHTHVVNIKDIHIAYEYTYIYICLEKDRQFNMP